ncbi:hypothetical protein K440DRAFT_661691 [Wilcoxina mikolae CBS 423.85]|nr:hypothetical protein K440DRAFT_661691 [Wilcoxina mikolae CBS 423.85]
MSKPAKSTELTAAEVFQHAVERYLSRLPESQSLDIELFRTTPAELLEEARAMEATARKNSRIQRVAERLKRPIERLERFARVVDACVQSNPTIAALVWGGLKFLMQVVREFTTFFEKLLQMIETMTSTLPDLEDFFKLLSYDESMKMCLASIYEDVLEFWGTAASIFVKHDKKGKVTRRRTVGVIANVCWTPFDTRFGEIIGRFEEHSEALRRRKDIAQLDIVIKSLNEQLDKKRLDKERVDMENERLYGDVGEETKEAVEIRQMGKDLQKKTRQLQEFRAVNAEYERADATRILGLLGRISEDARRRQEEAARVQRETWMHRIMLWLNPISFLDSYERTLSARLPGSCMWILLSETYKQWSLISSDIENDHRLLWIHGNPGCGKTHAAALIIDDLNSMCNAATSDSSPGVAYFFGSFRDPRTWTAAGILTALLSQLLKANKDNASLIDAFSLAVTESTSAAATSVTELRELTKIVLRRCWYSFIVVDGLDECERDACEIVVKFFGEVSREIENCKIVVLGRSSDPSLLRGFVELPQLHISAHTNLQDIATYVESRLDTLLELGLGRNPQSLDSKSIIQLVTKSSNGMFLWARLILDYLSDEAILPDDRTELLLGLKFLEGLETLYLRVLTQLSKRSEPQRSMAKTTFMAVSEAVRPLSVEELEMVVSQQEKSLIGRSRFPNFPRTLSITCGGLVEITPGSTVQFIHLSVKEFIRMQNFDNTAGSDLNLLQPTKQFFHSEYQAQFKLATICAAYTLLSVNAGPLSGKKHQAADIDEVRSTYPFLEYCSFGLFWHVCKALTCPLPAGMEANIESLHKRLETLFRTRDAVVTVIEAFYAFGHQALWEKLISDLQRIPSTGDLRGKLVAMLLVFFKEMQMLHQDFHQVLCADPHEIWTGVTGFLPEGSFLKSSDTSGVVVRRFEPEVPWTAAELGIDLHTSPYFTVSKFSADGRTLGIARIWTTTAFENSKRKKPSKAKNRFSKFLGLMRKTPTSTSTSTSINVSQGWVLQVEKSELTKIADKTLPTSFEILLESEEVSWQLRHGPCPKFPVVFSDDLSMIAVLTSVYCLEQFPGSSSVKRPVTPLLPSPSVDFSYHNVSFSIDGDYLAYFVNRGTTKSESHEYDLLEIGVCHLGVHHDGSYKALWTRHHRDVFKMRNDIKLEVSLHPSLPLIAWSSQATGTAKKRTPAVISCFRSDASVNIKPGQEHKLAPEVVKQLKFSSCGTLVSGIYGVGTPKSWPVGYLAATVKSLPPPPLRMVIDSASDCQVLQRPGPPRSLIPLTQPFSTPARTALSLSNGGRDIARQGNENALYSLNYLGAENDLQLTRRTESGAIESRSLARLPSQMVPEQAMIGSNSEGAPTVNILLSRGGGDQHTPVLYQKEEVETQQWRVQRPGIGSSSRWALKTTAEEYI